MKTGGGVPPKPNDDETAKIISIIGDDLDDLGNDIDSNVAPSKLI